MTSDLMATLDAALTELKLVLATRRPYPSHRHKIREKKAWLAWTLAGLDVLHLEFPTVRKTTTDADVGYTVDEVFEPLLAGCRVLEEEKLKLLSGLSSRVRRAAQCRPAGSWDRASQR